MEDKKFNLGGFIEGMLIGGAIGAVVALFAAPHSGMETRQLIREKGEELRDKTVQTIDNARGQVETVISDTRHRADEVVQRIGEQIGSQSHQE